MSSTYPKPWSISGMFAGSHRVVDANEHEVTLCDDLPTALEIVSAVNSHADLLAACEQALKIVALNDDAPNTVAQLKAAIAKARGHQ